MNFTEKLLPMGTALAVLACSLLVVPHPASAQDNAAPTSLRERIKERRQARQEARSGAQTPTAGGNRIEQPGDYNFTLEHGGHTRHYRVHVPRNYQTGKPTPLLMAFHGGGGNMDYQASDENYGLISKSESAGFIAVFPNGYSKLPSGKFATWNAGNCCADARDHNVDDVGFVRQILSDLHGRLSIDRKRIYATGMSNGGMMAYRLACEMPDTFAAIAAVAGTDNTAQCAPKRPIAVLHIHAQNDDRVLYNGGAGRKFGDVSKVTDFTSVPATVSRWVAHNSCSPTPQRTLSTAGAYCDRYAPCQGGTSVQLCVTDSGGHSWPGGHKARAGETPSQAISANDVMWEFFTAVSGGVGSQR
ncbi:prolyl oligopeptidase family serine peptidase [Rhodoferax sp. AJA081-3]|uniref:extracellular catalytic domain type 1 short-chain-length polyhydroxyalkanoate depolymerase n=1 Tax=Rhodoferax sp. AJA081-3 TaxID=2752316 RepID=UPI001AE06393|nr:PHB depolymerase family esterase [Rhodoferax sp. AJA081-3]QTN29434.1 prolyl oligopeptidase family serine peptidase [Rhodoferax sp. AJA081-3]